MDEQANASTVSRRSLVEMTRRRFLGAGTAGIAAVGLVGAGVLPLFEDDGAASEGAATAAASAPAASADSSGLVAPLTAHISDLSSGELSIFVEDRTLQVNDPALALRLLQAGR